GCFLIMPTSPRQTRLLLQPVSETATRSYHPSEADSLPVLLALDSFVPFLHSAHISTRISRPSSLCPRMDYLLAHILSSHAIPAYKNSRNPTYSLMDSLAGLQPHNPLLWHSSIQQFSHTPRANSRSQSSSASLQPYFASHSHRSLRS